MKNKGFRECENFQNMDVEIFDNTFYVGKTDEDYIYSFIESTDEEFIDALDEKLFSKENIKSIKKMSYRISYEDAIKFVSNDFRENGFTVNKNFTPFEYDVYRVFYEFALEDNDEVENLNYTYEKKYKKGDNITVAYDVLRYTYLDVDDLDLRFTSNYTMAVNVNYKDETYEIEYEIAEIKKEHYIDYKLIREDCNSYKEISLKLLESLDNLVNDIFMYNEYYLTYEDLKKSIGMLAPLS